MTKPEIVEALKPLFYPGSVAVIGATNNLTKWGFSTLSSLLGNFQGDLFAVNNRDPMVLERKAYPSVKDIPAPVDLAVIVIPAERVSGVMRECAEKGVKAAVVISAGFVETGPAGKAMQDEVMAVADAAGIKVVGPNCMGMYSAPHNLTAFMFPLPIMAGPLALISQGGNVGGALVMDAVTRGVGFQQYVSCGAAAGVKIEDYVEYVGHDDLVKVVMVYIEGLEDGPRFIEKVREVSRKKPVIVLKPGRTEAAARAISSHSGALSGSDSIYDAAFKKAGAIRVETSIEMLDLAIGLLSQPLPKGRRVVITTPGGSYGVMCADACASRGLEVIDLPRRAMDEFNRMFPPRWSHGNPVDPAGDRNFAPYLRAPEIILESDEVDSLIFMGFGSFSGIGGMIASSGDAFSKGLEKLNQGLAGVSAMASSMLEVLESGDNEKIKQIIKMALRMTFGSVMASDGNEIERLSDTVAEALTTDAMLAGSFFQGLKRLFESAASGKLDASGFSSIMGMMEPMLDALIYYWIGKYEKPVITTTFTEETSVVREGGHFPYPNAERAASVLARLVEYREFLESAEEEEK